MACCKKAFHKIAVVSAGVGVDSLLRFVSYTSGIPASAWCATPELV
jgi:hypothetical protein